LRIGRASGSLIETSRSVIFRPRARRSICSLIFSQRPASWRGRPRFQVTNLRRFKTTGLTVVFGLPPLGV